MAVLGNLALLLDVTSPRTTTVTDRNNNNKPRHLLLPSDIFLHLFKKDSITSAVTSNANVYASLPSKGGIEFDKENSTRRGRKANSKFNEVDYESSSDEENGNGYGDDEEMSEVERRNKKRLDWEKEMRLRVKEVEDMRELEKKAEELTSRDGEGDDGENGGDGDEEGEGVEEDEEQKRMRVRKELEKVAKEQAERRKMAELMFDLGQKAYGKGMYGRSIEFLEGALTIIPRPTLFGGEIQIWLAMAYEANNRHKDCIDLYRKLEMGHPSFSIRRQAKDLRYILQAPKLKISQEEMVTIPLIGSSYDRRVFIMYRWTTCLTKSLLQPLTATSINAAMQELGVIKTRTEMIGSTDRQPIRSRREETTLVTFWYGGRQVTWLKTRHFGQL